MSGSADIVNRSVTIVRGKLAPVAGDGEIGPPGSGATITIYDQTKDYPITGVALPGVQLPQCPFSRLVFSMLSFADSAAGGVEFSESQDDGVNFDVTATATYSQVNGLITYDYLCRGGHPRLRYTNTAFVLTAWRFTLTGVIGDRAPGGVSATTYINLPAAP